MAIFFQVLLQAVKVPCEIITIATSVGKYQGMAFEVAVQHRLVDATIVTALALEGLQSSMNFSMVVQMVPMLCNKLARIAGK